MAQTSGGALKTLVESILQPLMTPPATLVAYRKRAKAGVPRPYVTIQERIALTPDGLEDGGPGTVVETCQVDLFQDWKNLTTGAIAENYALLPALERGLHGARTAAIAGSTCYRVFVTNSVDIPEPEEENLVHAALTVELWRNF